MLFSGLNFWSSVVTLRNVERERESAAVLEGKWGECLSVNFFLD